MQNRLGSDRPVSLVKLDVPTDSGFSNETFFVDIDTDGTRERFVLRREPTRNPIFVGKNLTSQYELLRALNESKGVPVPIARWIEEDTTVLGAQFFVMERLDGLAAPDAPPFNLSGWIADGTPSQRETLWWSCIDALAKIHRLNWRDAGLSFLSGGPGRRSELECDIAYFESLFDLSGRAPYPRLITDTIAWLRSHLPPEKNLSLCWGDARPANMLFQDWHCTAVLDWEMATLGAAEKDFAYWLFLDRYYTEGIGVARLPGWPSHAATIARYTALLGRPLENMQFYMVLAAFRALIIYVRFVAVGLTPVLPENQCPGARLLRAELEAAGTR
jgi:aminoglycoside phosphotransferase (APT) family kinase protein